MRDLSAEVGFNAPYATNFVTEYWIEIHQRGTRCCQVSAFQVSLPLKPMHWPVMLASIRALYIEWRNSFRPKHLLGRTHYCSIRYTLLENLLNLKMCSSTLVVLIPMRYFFVILMDYFSLKVLLICRFISPFERQTHSQGHWVYWSVQDVPPCIEQLPYVPHSCCSRWVFCFIDVPWEVEACIYRYVPPHYRCEQSDDLEGVCWKKPWYQRSWWGLDGKMLWSNQMYCT